jgi:hypothetical protein
VRSPAADRQTVTARPWPYELEQYGAEETYIRAAAWLYRCETVADWGGAGGFFRRYLPDATRYTLVDGTLQASDQVLADLLTYRESSDGILLRHVLDNTPDWQPILANAIVSFRRRMVVVTFVPEGSTTHRIERASGWPYWQFNPDDLRHMMGELLVKDEAVTTTHPERVYYLERR